VENKTVEMVVKDLLLADNRKNKTTSTNFKIHQYTEQFIELNQLIRQSVKCQRVSSEVRYTVQCIYKTQ